MMRPITFKCLCITGLVMLACCTGGSGGSSNSGPTSSGAPPPVTSPDGPSSGGTPVGDYKVTCQQGRQAIEGSGSPRHRGKIESINSDGSVVIDGIVYSTNDASIYVNGACGNVTELGYGDIVTVIGTSDTQSRTGSAAAIFSDDDVAGAVLELDVPRGTLNVAGQAISVDAGTVYDDSIRPGTLSSLTLWDNIAVSGVVQADGSLVASRIDRWPTNAGWRVAGIVHSLDAAQHLLTVNQVKVRYTNATIVGFQNDTVHNGDDVRVQGAPLWVVPGFSCCEAADGGINAGAMELNDILSAQPVEVASGMVTRWNSTTDFAIAGLPVTTDAHTKQSGLTGDWLQSPPGPWMTAVGPVDSNGILHAALLEEDNAGTVVLRGPVTGVDVAARTVEIASVPADVDSWTVLGRLDGPGIQPVDLAAVSIGDQLMVQGDAVGPEGHVAAYMLTQAPTSRAFYIWTWFDQRALNRPDLTVRVGSRDLSVTTTSSTQYYWGHTLGSGCSCSRRTADRFWNQPLVPPGASVQTIEIVGTWDGDHVVADKVFWLQE